MKTTILDYNDFVEKYVSIYMISGHRFFVGVLANDKPRYSASFDLIYLRCANKIVSNIQQEPLSH